MLGRLLDWLGSWLGPRRSVTPAAPISEAEWGTEIAVDPLDGELDLHTFRPAESAELVREYVLSCQAKGVYALRIVHGKGKGVQRRIVHSVLDSMPEVVLSYRLAESRRGGWGATLVELRTRTRVP